MTTYQRRGREEEDRVRQAQTSAVAVFFDRTQSIERRLRASSSVGTLTDDEVQRGWATFDDPAEDPRIRAAALHALVNALVDDPERIEQVLDRLVDPRQPYEVRMGILVALQNGVFASRVAVGFKPAYLNALRELVDAELPALREPAMEYLSLMGDDYVQERLIEGLEQPEKALVAPELAIQLLANNLHTRAIPVLRTIARQPPNPASKREALRNLAHDAESAPLLEATVRDPTEEPEVRHLSAVGLFQTDPRAATEAARAVVRDDRADDELRAALLNTLLHVATAHRVASDPDFDAKVADLAAQDGSTPLAKMARRYVDDARRRA